MRTRLKKILLPAFLALLVALASGTVGAGTIYKWIDDSGVTHFGDTPPQAKEYSTPEIKINSYTSTSVETNSESTVNSVLMYSTSWCTYCKKARKYFTSKGIPYKEYDIEKSPAARRAYDKLGGKGVPVILVGDKKLNGFSVESFEKIYKPG